MSYNLELAGSFISNNSNNSLNSEANLSVLSLNNTSELSDPLPQMNSRSSSSISNSFNLVNGTLAATGPTNPTRRGTFRDDYLLNGLHTGQVVRVNMNSKFDNYLQLINADTGALILRNDDFNGSNAQITFTVQPGIDYIIRATSFNSNATGTYSLKTNVGELAPRTPLNRNQVFMGALDLFDPANSPPSEISFDPIFSSFRVFDASGDTTNRSVFENGAIRFGYDLANATSLSHVRLEAISNNSVVSTLGTWNATSLSDQLINLAGFSGLSGGNFQLRAIASTTSGQEFFSSSETLSILGWNRINGTFAGETLNYTPELGAGAVIIGRGGTDTLNLLGIAQSSISTINGISLGTFNPWSGSTANQAIFGGTAFDHITLADGREIYLQGIENLRFADDSIFELQVRTNDTFFGSQWNLHVSDVGSAWRFTQGASDVLLASLDTGILTATGARGDVVDISMSRLITDPSDDDNYNNYGHGHAAISIMSATANNASGISGINWNSDVLVNDVYGSSRVNLQQAIRDTIAYARARNQRVVFQGGIQGEAWLNSGGTREQLEQLIRENADIAIFAIAAGNGGIDIDTTDSNNPRLNGGVARLQTTHDNVMSVGALARTGTTVNSLANATSVNRASYSNFGSSLTLMAATDSPAMDKFGNMRFFGGTSAASPNLAGIASLVWSVNSSLTAGQIRQILIDTAMDLGTAGRDDNFGHGLVNADAAVRRASALQRSSDVANLYSGQSIFV